MATFDSLLDFTRASTGTATDRFGNLATRAVDEQRLEHDPASVTTSATTLNLGNLSPGDEILIDLPGSDTFAKGEGMSVTASGDIDAYLTAKVTASNAGSVDAVVKTVNGTASGSSWVVIRNLGLLIEEQRTNLLLWSESFNDSSWSKSRTTINENVALAPDGAVSADELVETTATGSHYIRQVVNVNEGDTYTYSVWAKTNDARFLQLLTTYAGSAVFDLNQETVTEIINGTAAVEKYANGYVRCSYTFVAGSDTNAIFDIRIKNSTTASSSSYEGDGTSKIIIWGAQLEQGSTPSSYIKTEGTQVTRAVDNCSRTLGSEFNPSEFTLLIEIKKLADDFISLVLDDGTNGNKIQIYDRNGTFCAIVIFIGGSVTYVADGANNITGYGKFALSFSNKVLVGFVNGVEVFRNYNATIPEINMLRISQNLPKSTSTLSKSFRIIPHGSTSAELIALTSGDA